MLFAGDDVVQVVLFVGDAAEGERGQNPVLALTEQVAASGDDIGDHQGEEGETFAGAAGLHRFEEFCAAARQFLKAGAAGFALAGLAGCAGMPGGSKARVAVVGGGYGGATAAKYIRMLDPSIEVVLIEPNEAFVSCPMSNLVLGGFQKK